MKIYNLLFGKSPCDYCLVKPMCHDGCRALNTWVRRSVRNVKLYSTAIKVGVLISAVALSGFKMSGDYINITINPLVMAIILVVIFISHPTVDFFKFKMLSYFKFKNRLNKHNRYIYDQEQTKL